MPNIYIINGLRLRRAVIEKTTPIITNTRYIIWYIAEYRRPYNRAANVKFM